MTLSYDEAVAAVTAAGGRYEIVETEVRDRPVRVFQHAVLLVHISRHWSLVIRRRPVR